MQPGEAVAGLLAPAGRKDPYPLYEVIRAHGNVVTIQPGVLAVLGYEECVRALRDTRLRVQDEESHDRSYPGWRAHSSLRRFTDSILYSNPPDHGRMRRMVTGAFTVRRVLGLRPAVERLVNRSLDRLAELGADGTEVEFMADFAFRLPVAVIGELLGVPEDEQVWFREMSTRVTVAFEGITDLSKLDDADAAMDALAEYFTRLIAHRREHPAGDLISALVREHDTRGDRLSLDELIGNLVLLLIAGFDTTTHLLGQCLWQTFNHPEHIPRLRTEPDFVTGYVEEALRMEPPVQATTRWAVSDVDLLGTHIPAGTKVLLILAAANRDPVRYPDPTRFDPTRPAIHPLTFGGGIHLCVGAALARIEAQITLPMLLDRFPAMAPCGPAEYRDRWLVRGHDRFPIVLGTGAVRRAG